MLKRGTIVIQNGNQRLEIRKFNLEIFRIQVFIYFWLQEVVDSLKDELYKRSCLHRHSSLHRNAVKTKLNNQPQIINGERVKLSCNQMSQLLDCVIQEKDCECCMSSNLEHIVDVSISCWRTSLEEVRSKLWSDRAFESLNTAVCRWILCCLLFRVSRAWNSWRKVGDVYSSSGKVSPVAAPKRNCTNCEERQIKQRCVRRN